MKSRVRASVVLVHNDRVLTILCVDPHSGREYYFLPGGAIEADETAPEAAARETHEETGFRAMIDASSAIDREYLFHWNNEDFDCLTIFYWGRLISPMQDKITDVEYNKGVAWIPLADLDKTFSYSKEISSAIMELIEKHKS